jgi:hypothetical protein
VQQLIALAAVAGLGVAMGIFAWLAAGAAEGLGRSRLGWALLGLLSGPIALRILRLAPPVRCGVCLSPVRGWGPDCTVCGGDVFADPISAWRSRVEGAAPLEPGHAAPGASPAQRATGPGAAARMTASAVFVSGTVPLVPGRRYWLDITDTHLQVTAPLAALPNNRPLSWGVRDIRPVATGGHFIIRGARPPFEDTDLTFRALRLGATTRNGEHVLSGLATSPGWRVRLRERLGPPVVATASAVVLATLAASMLLVATAGRG